MNKIRCAKCGKELKSDMEIEYSEWINEFFCSPDCAMDRYFEYMQSCCVDFSQSLPMKTKVKDGYLIWNE